MGLGVGFGGAAGLPEVGVDGLAHLDLEGEVGAPGRDEGVDAVAGPELDGVLEAVDLDGERRDAVVAVGEARRARARVEGDEVARVELKLGRSVGALVSVLENISLGILIFICTLRYLYIAKYAREEGEEFSGSVRVNIKTFIFGINIKKWGYEK